MTTALLRDLQEGIMDVNQVVWTDTLICERSRSRIYKKERLGMLKIHVTYGEDL